MRKPALTPHAGLDRIPRIPGWIRLGQGQTPEEAAFLSGAALAHLHLVTACEDLPQDLWRARLALGAAEACAGFAGRRERVAELRDALHLTRVGDQPGPAGEIAKAWAAAVARPISGLAISGLAVPGLAVPGIRADRVALYLDLGRGLAPVARAAGVLQAVLVEALRAETAALVLADAALARALGWPHVVPLLACGLTAGDLRKEGDALRLACHLGIVASARTAVGMAADLIRKAGHLRAVAPNLRAKGAADAVEMFLTRDALAPSGLTGLLSDRAARRLCDRLVALGALREVTGRDTFRLYGV